MRTELQKVLRYFLQFGYRPTFQEIYTFFPTKISKNKLRDYVDRTQKYTVGEYGNKFSQHTVGFRDSEESGKVRSSQFQDSLTKISKAQSYIDFISLFPQLRLIGLSGSVAMLSASQSDDLDLFIVSAQNRLWTARFISNTAAWFFGLKRSRDKKQAKDKVCLNLFFSESHLTIAKDRRTEYMAHEVLQMMPILDVNHTYRTFLTKNDWIHAFFPNVRLDRYLPNKLSHVRGRKKNSVRASGGVIGNLVEYLCRWLQLSYMSKPKGAERIEEGQLWFHPRDYSRMVKSKV